jgi:hypothetical protein
VPAHCCFQSPGFYTDSTKQVSPYNLWSVRFLRYFTVLFAIVTFLWWVLLLVSIFVSPPGMHSRGSGLHDFNVGLAPRRPLILLYAIQGCTGDMPGHFCYLAP